MRTSTVIKALLAAAAVAPMLCLAESNVQTGAGALTATAHVDFQITIPKFVFLRIGTGTGTLAGGWANSATVDQITWAPAPAAVGTGVLAGTGGDLGTGTETAAVYANGNGNVTLSCTTSGPLNDGAGDTISYATITTATSTLTSATALPVCPLGDGTTNSVVVPAVAKIVSRDAKWAYSYTNATVPPAGTYGGGGAGNTGAGRVTYTAAIP
ncbi:MAG TPA: hypothetical protein VE819_10605 [Steroidobacteraceae bacterium]|jgi:hypothetical protein|nr:hypothetical protein [Steroidobacteraceae bacterium]